jgi:hypothetical protein
METKSIGQAKYFLLFVDDASRMSFVYLLLEGEEPDITTFQGISRYG